MNEDTILTIIICAIYANFAVGTATLYKKSGEEIPSFFFAVLWWFFLGLAAFTSDDD